MRATLALIKIYENAKPGIPIDFSRMNAHTTKTLPEAAPFRSPIAGVTAVEWCAIPSSAQLAILAEIDRARKLEIDLQKAKKGNEELRKIIDKRDRLEELGKTAGLVAFATAIVCVVAAILGGTIWIWRHALA